MFRGVVGWCSCCCDIDLWCIRCCICISPTYIIIIQHLQIATFKVQPLVILRPRTPPQSLLIPPRRRPPQQFLRRIARLQLRTLHITLPKSRIRLHLLNLPILLQQLQNLLLLLLTEQPATHTSSSISNVSSSVTARPDSPDHTPSYELTRSTLHRSDSLVTITYFIISSLLRPSHNATSTTDDSESH